MDKQPPPTFHRFSPAATLIARGEDAFSFLQSQFSNDLRNLSANGGGTYGFFLDRKGKIEADALISKFDDETYALWSIHTPAERILARLEPMIIADDVEFEDHTTTAQALALWSYPTVESSLQPVIQAHPQAIAFAQATATPLAALLICFLSSEAANYLPLPPTLPEIDAQAFAQRRIQQGFPAFPDELGPAVLTGELGLDPYAISYTKGCFTGQEVVARMHNLGRPQRALYRIEGSGSPSLPLSLTNPTDTKEVGTVHQIVPNSANTWSALALLKTRRLPDKSTSELTTPIGTVTYAPTSTARR